MLLFNSCLTLDYPWTMLGEGKTELKRVLRNLSRIPRKNVERCYKIKKDLMINDIKTIQLFHYQGIRSNYDWNRREINEKTNYILENIIHNQESAYNFSNLIKDVFMLKWNGIICENLNNLWRFMEFFFMFVRQWNLQTQDTSPLFPACIETSPIICFRLRIFETKRKKKGRWNFQFS